jgi:hypothetical protein
VPVQKLSRNILTVKDVRVTLTLLWLVSYTHDAFSDGSPYERAMKRQRHFGMENGDKCVASHPAHDHSYHICVRCSVRYFHVFLSSLVINIIFSLSISPIQAVIGYVVGAILVLGSRNISCCSVLCRMPIPFLFFGYTTFKETIKMDVPRAFTEEDSMAVDWMPHIFVGRIMLTDSIWSIPLTFSL